MFQGGTLPIPWPAENPFLHQQGYIDVDPVRLPPGMPGLAHPDWYDENTTLIWSDWIIRGQTGIHEKAKAFQFRRLSDTHIDTEYRDVPHPNGRLYYGPDSRLFVARMHNLAEDDEVARLEVEFQLPNEAGETPYKVFRSGDIKDINQRISSARLLKTLFDHVLHYEAMFPMQVSIRY